MSSKNESGILKLLLKQFSRTWTLTSLAEETHLSRAGIWKILKRLQGKNFIQLSRIGNGKTSTLVISLNWENPLLEKNLSLILTEDVLKHQRWLSNFKELEKKTDFLILYGSILHSQKEARDIDILAIISHKNNFISVEHTLQKIQKTQLKKIHLESFTMAEFKSEIKKPNKIFVDAIKKGIVLFGQENFIKFMREITTR